MFFFVDANNGNTQRLVNCPEETIQKAQFMIEKMGHFIGTEPNAEEAFFHQLQVDTGAVLVGFTKLVI